MDTQQCEVSNSQRKVQYFDLNELPNEEMTDMVQSCAINNFSDSLINDNENYVGQVEMIDEDDGFLSQTNFEPFIGQCFLSEEEAFLFYQKYANQFGFAVRKGRFISKDGQVKRRDFFCHREGFPQVKFEDPSKVDRRDRASARCGCKAHMRITLRKSFDIFPKEWHVTKFVHEHNHALITPSEMHFLSTNRNITESDEARILLLKEAGLSVRQVIRVMELEKNAKHGCLPFLDRDIRNLYYKIKRSHSKNDAMEILTYCKLAKEENSNFQYAYTTDEQSQLEHIFWCPTTCFEWYKNYGDAVVFDTTYKVNSYDMPFGIFVGVNNHGKTMLFGCALLRNETTSAFRWLMKSFMDLMKKPPQTILTDQDPWLTEAIAKELPTTEHGFCIWHITAKFSGWFTAILRNKYYEWCDAFYKLYWMDTVEEFEHEWPKVISMYNLEDNKHVNGLYKIKQFWVPAYLRGCFFGGMTTTGRSESINAFVKRFIDSRTCLSQFVRQVKLAIETIEHTEAHDTMLDKCNISTLRTMSPLEEQARSILTSFAFKKFQDELVKASQYLIYSNVENIFVLKHFKESTSRKHKVYWDGKIAKCSCKQFEFWGILCRHILSVLSHKDCFEIPIYYLPSRWCRDVLHRKEECSAFYGNNTTSNIRMNDNSLMSEGNVVHCPPTSKTKGRPRQKRMRGGVEFAKQSKTCSLCKCSGHNISTCPEKENIDSPSNHVKKKNKMTSEDIGLNPIFHLKVDGRGC